MQLDGRRILITGASSGIGRALAGQFARRKASLILAARREALLSDVAREIASSCSSTPAPLIMPCDVRDEESVHHLIESSVTRLGGVDILVNNAGVSVYGNVEQTSPVDFHTVMDVNFFGSLNCTLQVLPFMKRAGSGLIVNIASLAALHGAPYLAAYSASKAAMVACGQSLRADLRGTGVNVMNVYPNHTRTPLFEHEKKVGGARRPYKRYADVDEVASRIVRAIERDRQDLILSRQGKALCWLQSFWPSLIEKEFAKISERLKDRQEGSHA